MSLPSAHEAKAERPVDAGRIGRGVAPGRVKRVAERRRACGEFRLVFSERQGRLEGPFGERSDQRGGVARRDVVTGRAQSLDDDRGARGRVEADGVSGASAARRIVGQDAGEALLRRGLQPQRGPTGRERRDERDAIGERPVRDRAELGRRVARMRRLE